MGIFKRKPNLEITPEMYNAIKQQFEEQQRLKSQALNNTIVRKVAVKPLKQGFVKPVQKIQEYTYPELEIMPKRCLICNSKLSKSDILIKEGKYIQLIKCKNRNCNFQKEITVSGD